LQGKLLPAGLSSVVYTVALWGQAFFRWCIPANVAGGGMTDTQHLYASPEASQVAVTQPVQKELLGDTGCSTPVGGQLSYCGLRWQIAIAIRRANSFADT